MCWFTVHTARQITFSSTEITIMPTSKGGFVGNKILLCGYTVISTKQSLPVDVAAILVVFM